MKRVSTAVGIILLAVFGSTVLLMGQSGGVTERKDNAEEAQAYNVTRVVKTVENLNFLVQEDRPIEKVAGLYQPIDIDSYVALKFNKLNNKLDETASYIEEQIQELSRRLSELEQRVGRIAAAANASSTAAPRAPAANVTSARRPGTVPPAKTATP